MTSKEWKKYKLSEIAEFNPIESIKKGQLVKKIAMEKLIPYCKHIPSFEISKYNGGAKFRNGDTIMARITPCLENGKISKVTILDYNEVGFGSTEYIVFRAIEKMSDPDFLYYLITSSLVKEPAIKSMVGSSGRQRVQTDVVKSIEITIPPLETQQKIAKVLSAIDDKIELNNSINNNLEQQVQAIFKSWFVDFEPFGGTMPNDWCVGCLSDIATITMGQSPSGSSYNENKMGTLFFQGRAEFGYRYPKDRLYTTEPKRIAKANDILISVRAPVGDINIALKECCIGRGLAAIEPKNRYNSFVFYSVLNLKKQLNIFNGEGTVFGSINKDSLNGIKTLIPSKEIVKNFEKIVSPMDNLIKYNCIQNERLTQLRDTLLPKLMSGEIDVSKVAISTDKLLFNEEDNNDKL